MSYHLIQFNSFHSDCLSFSHQTILLKNQPHHLGVCPNYGQQFHRREHHLINGCRWMQTHLDSVSCERTFPRTEFLHPWTQGWGDPTQNTSDWFISRTELGPFGTFHWLNTIMWFIFLQNILRTVQYFRNIKEYCMIHQQSINLML